MVAQIVKDELRHAAGHVRPARRPRLGRGRPRARATTRAFTMRIDDQTPTSARRGSPTTSGSTSSTTRSTPGPTSSSSTSAWTAGPGHQLEDVRQCSYGPWVRAIEGIFKEEKFHIRHGEYWVKRLAEDPATKPEAQATFAQVVHPHHEHLRPPRQPSEIGSIGSYSSSSATTTRSAPRSPPKSPASARSSGSRSRRGSPSGRSCRRRRRSRVERRAGHKPQLASKPRGIRPFRDRYSLHNTSYRQYEAAPGSGSMTESPGTTRRARPYREAVPSAARRMPGPRRGGPWARP